MENKILHCVQNDNLPPTVIASRFCEAISIHKPKADCHVATLLAKTENDLGEVKPRLTGCLRSGESVFIVPEKRSKTNTLFSLSSVLRRKPA